MMSPQLALALGGGALLAGAGGVAVLSRALRRELTIRGDSRGRSRRHEETLTPLASGLARTLTERGLVNAQQLANMSAAEREFFVATVATQVGAGTKPRLVHTAADPRGAVPTALARPLDHVADRPREHGESASGGIAPSALGAGPIHGPICRAALGERSSTPLRVARCPGCARRVSARVDGARLTVTVAYGAPTPPVGTAAIPRP